MPTNSNSEFAENGHDPEGTFPIHWEVMTEQAEKLPGLSVLDAWIEHSLTELEQRFHEFQTQGSTRRSIGR